MRIIAGTRRSRIIKSLPGESTRPTLDVVKEAGFAKIGPWIQDKKGLDLFAGSGNIGLEALSRGAKSVSFVDGSSQACQIIKENIKSLDLIEQSSVYRMDCFQACRYFKSKNEVFDFVYLDPPYQKLELNKLLSALYPITAINSLIIYECLKEEKVEILEPYSLDKTSSYGRIALYFIRRTV
ncbi:MAG: 16S rRNA (guanine(966)-N(2))-methyltransferase RsmD [Ignavibacteria bacterium]|nr:16S rRNA (guanine(966)-N(2))-methyltransferase RsmD [Ignavibacteria bacterium]